MDLAALTARLNEFDGFDLSDSESADLLNEARRELALRSRYPRKIDDIASTVSGTSAYDWPTDLLLPLTVEVGGLAYEASDYETAKQIARGNLEYSGDGLWFDAPDSEGVRKLNLYPAPSAVSAITLEWVYRPTPLSESTDEPSEFPEEFHAKLLNFAGAQYYRTVEDDPELANDQERLANDAVAALIRYDNSRATGDNPWLVGIVGSTA